MANEFLNDYTDYLKEEYSRWSNMQKEAVEKKDYNREALCRECTSAIWFALEMYRWIILKRARFSWQRSYAERVLRELNEPLYEACLKESRKRRASKWQ